MQIVHQKCILNIVKNLTIYSIVLNFQKVFILVNKWLLKNLQRTIFYKCELCMSGSIYRELISNEFKTYFNDMIFIRVYK